MSTSTNQELRQQIADVIQEALVGPNPDPEYAGAFSAEDCADAVLAVLAPRQAALDEAGDEMARRIDHWTDGDLRDKVLGRDLRAMSAAWRSVRGETTP